MGSAPPARRIAFVSALLAFVGALTSGPVGLWFVGATHPQPTWKDVETFVLAYHPVQSLPFFCGFLLVGAMVALVASLHVLAPPTLRPRTTIAVALTGAFAAMIFVNYAIQTTFVPAMVRNWSLARGSAIDVFTMANPRSLAWALEMWGYAILGVATWLSAPVFAHVAKGAWASAAKVSFIANGPVSIAGGVLTALRPGWVEQTAGLAAFAGWNILVFAMTLSAAFAVRQPDREDSVRARATVVGSQNGSP
jgi:hypothetical protein